MWLAMPRGVVPTSRARRREAWSPQSDTDSKHETPPRSIRRPIVPYCGTHRLSAGRVDCAATSARHLRSCEKRRGHAKPVTSDSARRVRPAVTNHQPPTTNHQSPTTRPRAIFAACLRTPRTGHAGFDVLMPCDGWSARRSSPRRSSSFPSSFDQGEGSGKPLARCPASVRHPSTRCCATLARWSG
jgi:hypothetical protein